MKWIGLTGGIGSGKTTVANCFRAHSVPVLDADEIAKEVVGKGTPGLQNVVNEFGRDILQHDQSLDRRKLGQLVFASPEKLTKLENIIHPLVQAEIRRQRLDLEKKKYAFAIYDVPLLFEKKLSGFDAIIVVNSSEKNQRERLKKRNQWSDQEITNRLASQIPLSEKLKLASYVIENNSDEKNIERQVQELIKKLS